MLQTVDTAAQATRIKHVLARIRLVAQRPDLPAFCGALRTACAELLAADRAHVVLCDLGQNIAWREEDADTELPLYQGLVSQVVRHGRAYWAPQAGAATGYYRPLDDPQGNGREALMLQPVHGRSGEIHAVLVVVRNEGRGPFDPFSLHLLGVIAAAAGPALDQLSWMAEAEAIIADDPDHDHLADALAARRERQRHGDIIRITPRFIGVTYWLLLVMVLVSIVGLAVARTGRYAAGQAIVRAQGRTEVVAPIEGSLTAIDVQPGEVVEAGQVLARLDDRAAQRELARRQRAFEQQLRRRLHDPADPSGASALAALRQQRDAAADALARLQIRAPVAGRVADVRLRPGQSIRPGEPLLVLVDDTRPLEVVALLPGHQRPELRPGMTLRLELWGYPNEYQALTVEAVDEQVVGPAEAQRLLGPQIADSLPMQGALAVVRASLPAHAFETELGPRRYHDGMQGSVELRLRDEPVVFALLPALAHLSD